MNELKFTRTNGNIPKTLAGKDHVSGLLYYVGTGEVPESFATDAVQLVSSIETAEKLGITADAEEWNIRNLHYQLSEIYRLNSGVTLYLGVFQKPAGDQFTFAEIKQMQNFANGDIRQIGVYNGSVAVSATHITSLQGVATMLQEDAMPLVILYAPKVDKVTTLAKNLATIGNCNVSVVIGQDGDGTAATLHADAMRGGQSVTGLGIVLGLVSAASVHECIGWVRKFPTGVSLPAFGDGTLYRSLDKGVIEGLDDARFIFFRTYTGLNGSFVNDSHTMDVATSDFAMIENVRTMDKAVRGIRTYLLPELGSPLAIDAETGELSPEMVQHLETVASQQLEDMQKAGELSGYIVTIDPKQNVLKTSKVEFVVKNVSMGVFRKGHVEIGYAQSV